MTALERYEPDALRYALAANLPETSDVDITEAELVRRINEELVATWGNLVNRVVSMTHRYFDGVVPLPGDPEWIDLEVLRSVDTALAEAADHLERCPAAGGAGHPAHRGAGDQSVPVGA